MTRLTRSGNPIFFTTALHGLGKSLRLMLPLLLMVFVAFPVGAADRGDGYDIKDTVKRVFESERGGSLEIDADMGNVEIRAGKSGEVRVVVERIVSVNSKEDAKAVLETHNLDIDRKGRTIWVHSRVDRDRFSWRRSKNKLQIRIIVEVPDEYDLEVASGAGNIDVSDISGTLNIRTGAGNVAFANTGGTVDIVSGSGNINVQTTSGRMRIRNGSGNLTLIDLQGSLEADTGAGNITARIVGDLDGSSRLSTSAGNVTVELSNDVGALVRAVARVGNCSTDYPLQITGGWMKKSFDGPINGGGPELSLIADVGNVTLSRIN